VCLCVFVKLVWACACVYGDVLCVLCVCMGVVCVRDVCVYV